MQTKYVTNFIIAMQHKLNQCQEDASAVLGLQNLYSEFIFPIFLVADKKISNLYDIFGHLQITNFEIPFWTWG
jgi:hypothetical protein